MLKVTSSPTARQNDGVQFPQASPPALVRDQIGLRASDATDGEILTRQFELATGSSYYASVGLSYSFGSIFNQVVNPRLD